MTAQVASLSRAPANPNHLCGGNALPAGVEGSGIHVPFDPPQSPIPPDVADTWQPADDKPAPNLPVLVERPRPGRTGGPDRAARH
ncbi:hypothetical protein [Phytohabitans rumicis]|uniref:Uncharacterized protein n=1 Tax=Phytohabitans rumicis TaxID=1076125 RepID=A0A6V8KTZ0_9ACTN|nr:hypothetical protein [Phytohabitans rumicis]GFJ88562.1 hypothetical protein Prum_022040 [Phytohabitans rumicis]